MTARHTLPSLSTLESICDALGISMGEFFEEKNESEKLSQDLLVHQFNLLDEEAQQALLILVDRMLAKKKE